MGRFVVIVVILLSVSCKSQKVKVKTDTKTEIKEGKVSEFVDIKNVDISEYWQKNYLKSLGIDYDFTLKSMNDKPAKLTEFRNGKPYRTIIAENGEYSENKSENRKIKGEERKDYSVDFLILQKEFEKQNITINQLQTKVEKLKIDILKIANNIKYSLWFGGLLAVIWICERTGLFRVVKKVLNGL